MKQKNANKISKTAKKELTVNGSGCPDPTAYKAVTNVEKALKKGGYKVGKNNAEYRRFVRLLHAIWALCEASGFHLDERIVVTDKQTQRQWR